MNLKEVLDKVNWPMLYDQKLVLLDFLEFVKESPGFIEYLESLYEKDDPEGEYLAKEPDYSYNAIDGLINFLDDLGDAAEKDNVFTFPTDLPKQRMIKD
jgi:hypothetical protein